MRWNPWDYSSCFHLFYRDMRSRFFFANQIYPFSLKCITSHALILKLFWTSQSLIYLYLSSTIEHICNQVEFVFIKAF